MTLAGRRCRSHQVVTCLQCKAVKRFPVNAGHQLWSENPDAWLGTLPGGKNCLEAGLGAVPAGMGHLEAGLGAVPAEKVQFEAGLGTLPIGEIHS